MKVLEVFDEFKNLKPESAAAKYKYAERKVKALTHESNLIANYIEQFRNKRLGYSQTDNSNSPDMPGHVYFETRGHKGKTRYAFYSNLTPQEKTLLTTAYRKYCLAMDMYFKLNKNLATFKRNAAKETGTYISKNDAAKYELAFQKDMAKIVLSRMGPHGFQVYLGGTKTKKNGSSRIYVRVEPAHITSHTTSSEKAAFTELAITVKEKIFQWMVGMDFDLRVIAFKKNLDHRTVEFTAKVKTKDLVKKYGKNGG